MFDAGREGLLGHRPLRVLALMFITTQGCIQMKPKSSTSRIGALLAAALLAACSDSSQDAAVEAAGEGIDAPVARIEVVQDSIQGVTIDDPYRWLEDWDDEGVKAWSDGQNVYARHVLSSLPQRPLVHSRISEILSSAQSVVYSAVQLLDDGPMLAMKRDPDKQQSVLVRMGADADPSTEVALVDPNELDASGGTTIDWYRPSHSGTLVAVSMSRDGSESGDIHIFEVRTGEQVDVVVERVNGGTAGGDLAWFADDSGFYYTRYPREGDRTDDDAFFYQQIWRHTLGTSGDEDEYVLGENFPRIAASRLAVDARTGRLLVWTQDGDSSRFELHLRQADGTWNQFSAFGDGLVQAAFGPDDSLYVLDRAKTPRGRIIRLDASDPDIENAVEIVPQGEGSISHNFYYKFSPNMIVTNDRIYIIYQKGGPNELAAFSFDGEELAAPRQSPVSAVYGLTAAENSDVIFATESYVTMLQWFRYDAGNDSTAQLGISSESPVDYSDVEVVREFATSRDGTRVPVNILMPRGATKDSTNAIVVTGYGGYGLNVTPGLSMSRHILFEHGVLFAQANLRGGGEYGEEWHLQGNLTNKQNVFDDFAAVVRHLIAEGYADPDRVAIIGGSNGGLLMGATVTQHPDLAAAVVSHVGIYDMLRVELDPNGEFNIPEFGTVKDREQFEALYAYSPFHRVEDGVDYPPILVPTGANDPRVNPAHSRKFVARMQAAQGGDGEILLRTSGDTGHGGGTPLDEIIKLLTDQYAFIFHHLGVPLDVNAVD